MDKITQKRVVEALLFASAEPLPAQIIRERLPESADLGQLLAELKADYQGRGVELVEIGAAWALRTAPDLSDYLILEREETRQLSRAALETTPLMFSISARVTGW